MFWVCVTNFGGWGQIQEYCVQLHQWELKNVMYVCEHLLEILLFLSTTEGKTIDAENALLYGKAHDFIKVRILS